MIFEIITKYGTQTYSAQCKELKLKATCTCGQEYAAKAVATKVINYVVKFRDVKNPVIEEMVKIYEPSDHTAPVKWRLTLKEGGAK